MHIRRAGYTVLVAAIAMAGMMSLARAREPQAPAVQASLPATRADLKPIQVDDRLLKAPPIVELGSNGMATVAFDTMVPAPAARVYVGTLNPYTRLATPFFPIATTESLKEPSTQHRVTTDIRRLDTWLPRAAEGAVREGEAYIRLELLDPRSASARYFETHVHYAVLNGRYELRTTIRIGPVVDQVTTTSAVVSWETDRPAHGTVEVWSADGRRRIATFSSTGSPSMRHVVQVKGLRPRRTYQYRVLVTDQPVGPTVNTGAFYRFRTAPAGAAPFRFAFLSDGRPSLGGGFANFDGVNAEVTPRLLADAYRRGAEFAMFGGDLTAGYTSSVEHFGMMLDTWRHVVDPVHHVMPVYEGFGNHESLHDFFVDARSVRYSTDKPGERSSEAEFARRFANPGNAPEPEVVNAVTGPPYTGTVYSFDYGNSHFVMLNTDYWYTSGGPATDRSLVFKLLGGNRNGYLMANQMAWLERDLAAARARGVQHVFIAAHDPVFPVGGHVADAMWWGGLNDSSLPSGDVVAMRDRFLSIVSRYRATALLFGHEHTYARLVADATVAPALKRPIVEFVSGGAGAPFYPPDRSAPWAKHVRKYAGTFHYLLFSVEGAVVRFEAIDLAGHIIDQGVLQ
jgi:3',5'-cyclic AMP phosphodiesterase CpdA